MLRWALAHARTLTRTSDASHAHRTSQLPVVGDPSRDPRRARLRASRRPRPRRRRCGLPGPRGRVGAVAARGPGVRARWPPVLHREGEREGPGDQERCAAGRALLRCQRRRSSRPRTSIRSSNAGMLGIAFDPDFATTQYVYLYYSICKVPGTGMCQTAKNRVVRVTAGYQGSPDQADPTSQVILLDDIDTDAGIAQRGLARLRSARRQALRLGRRRRADPHQGAGSRIA